MYKNDNGYKYACPSYIQYETWNNNLISLLGLCCLVYEESMSHFGKNNMNWENSLTTFACGQACGTFSLLMIDMIGINLLWVLSLQVCGPGWYKTANYSSSSFSFFSSSSFSTSPFFFSLYLVIIADITIYHKTNVLKQRIIINKEFWSTDVQNWLSG